MFTLPEPFAGGERHRTEAAITRHASIPKSGLNVSLNGHCHPQQRA
jgi:hypothetical protein